jgi:dynein heavy chain 1
MVGEAVIGKLRKMRTTEDEEGDMGPTTTSETARPAWMSTLRTHVEDWLKSLPPSLSEPTVRDSPLSRFFARECHTGVLLLSRIRRDLEELVQVCAGTIKQTNETRGLMAYLNQGASRACVPGVDADDQVSCLDIG